MNTSRRSLLKLGSSLPLAALGGFQILVRAQDSKLPFATDNPVIQKARDAALTILKPTPQQLEKGLRLHQEALVLESYGFAPRCAIDGNAFQKAVEAGASADELQDLREEMSMSRNATDAAERKEFLDAFHAAGVTGIFQNAGEEGNDPMRLIKRLANFTKATDLLRPNLIKAVKPDDVLAAKKAGTLCLVFSGNGVPLPLQFESVRDELQLIGLFHRLGIRMMHLTYNRRNPIGDGAGEPHDGGLSDFGFAVVKEMNRVGVIVDVAHSGWKTSAEAAKASVKPMVASHTTAGGVYSHFRGKPDEAVKAICDTDGLVGVCCISRFLGGKGDINTLLDHLAYLKAKFGAKHVAIGTDIAYTSRNDATERARIKKRADGSSALGSAAERWEHLWPKDDYQTTPAAEQSIAWVNWPMFTVGMVQRGFSEAEIRMILGDNMLRVFRANVVA